MSLTAYLSGGCVGWYAPPDDPSPPLTKEDSAMTHPIEEQHGSVEQKPSYSGECSGGPYDGRTETVREPLGFLLVDADRRQAWTYDFDGITFTVRPDLVTLPEGGSWANATSIGFGIVVYAPDLLP